MQPPAALRRILFLAAVAALAASFPAGAFTLVKNVNSGKPLVEKVVIFEKGKPHDHLSIEATDNGKTVIGPDGSLVSKITGHDEMKIALHWKAIGDFKEVFDANKYDYLIMTCRLEGDNKVTAVNGKVSPQRGDNLWFGPVFFNAKGEVMGGANFADAAPDGKTPAQTVTLKLPIVLFTTWGHPIDQIQGIGFSWGKTRETINRDFTLVVDKIALANEP